MMMIYLFIIHSMLFALALSLYRTIHITCTTCAWMRTALFAYGNYKSWINYSGSERQQGDTITSNAMRIYLSRTTLAVRYCVWVGAPAAREPQPATSHIAEWVESECLQEYRAALLRHVYGICNARHRFVSVAIRPHGFWFFIAPTSPCCGYA